MGRSRLSTSFRKARGTQSTCSFYIFIKMGGLGRADPVLKAHREGQGSGLHIRFYLLLAAGRAQKLYSSMRQFPRTLPSIRTSLEPTAVRSPRPKSMPHKIGSHALALMAILIKPAVPTDGAALA
jgi:hypothetical protein